jgi:hypothetical protein
MSLYYTESREVVIAGICVVNGIFSGVKEIITWRLLEVGLHYTY